MSDPISIENLKRNLEHLTLVDVRKPKARMASGFELERTVHEHPFNAAEWHTRYGGHQLVIFCVHGHEVSQSVCGYLRDEGIDCRYVEGGFEALILNGFETVTIAGAHDEK
ncbi:MAG: hypothetical protein AAGG69_15040 [Pseudomonadota bacterium]